MFSKAASLKSEYQRSFRPEQFVCSASTYRNNQAFRRHQKSRFHGHSHDPFVWEDDDDILDDVCDNVDSGKDDNCTGCRVASRDAGVDRRRPAFVAPHEFKHHMWRQLYELKYQRRYDHKASQTDFDVVSERHDASCEAQFDDEQHQDSDSEASVVYVFNDGSPSKYTQTPECWSLPEKPPFAPYGFQNDEIEVGGKKTFNVKASKEIFPSALQALQRREDHDTRARKSLSLREQKQDRDAASSSAKSKTRVKPKSSGQCPEGAEQRNTHWQTEYANAFRPYEPSIYKNVRLDNGLRERSLDLLPSARQVHWSYPKA